MFNNHQREFGTPSRDGGRRVERPHLFDRQEPRLTAPESRVAEGTYGRAKKSDHRVPDGVAHSPHFSLASFGHDYFQLCLVAGGVEQAAEIAQ